MRNSWLFTFAIIFLCEVAAGQIPKTGNAFFGYSYSQGQVLSDAASGSIKLQAGKHTVVLTNPEFKINRSVPVMILPNETNRKRYDF